MKSSSETVIKYCEHLIEVKKISTKELNKRKNRLSGNIPDPEYGAIAFFNSKDKSQQRRDHCVKMLQNILERGCLFLCHLFGR